MNAREAKRLAREAAESRKVSEPLLWSEAFESAPVDAVPPLLETTFRAAYAEHLVKLGKERALRESA